jgi:group II intron reverse transcriptase/maturase
MESERRDCTIQPEEGTNRKREESRTKARPFCISQREVVEAFKQVRANQGAAGVDGQSITQFEANLRNNLYKLWNRMSSGSYFPPPVRRVEIPKGEGTRPLGIPTVADRIAQTVAKRRMEPGLEKCFHPDSYGYRPGRSAKDALGTARTRCWRYSWVLDLDIKAFFDSIDWALLLKAVRMHIDTPWVLLYIERWLKAPVRLGDGTLVTREKGTPQGSVVSPILANLFLHHAFDSWMMKHCPHIPFERYADDIICHCTTEKQALRLKDALERRFALCGLSLHPEKTKIVYCKDDDRKGRYSEEKFDFLGYTFMARRSKNRWGKYFVNFCPAVSNKAAKEIRHVMRQWALHDRSDKSLDDLARMFNPVLRGWINYYGCFYKSAMYPTLRHFDRILVRWARRKYKRLEGHRRRAETWLRGIRCRQPNLFAHWVLLSGQGWVVSAG